MPFVPFSGYAPDADPTTPGIFTECVNTVPTLKGFAGSPGSMDAGFPALSAACKGAASLQKLDNSTRVFAGTVNSLYELSGSTWVERSASTAGYSLGADQRWRYCQFGNVSLASAKTEKLQASTSTTFAAVAGNAPKASICETVNQFVILFDTDDTAYGDSPDRWFCCAQGDYTDWTPAIATQCATARLTSSPGKIKAGKRFGDRVVAYKDRAMYVGNYVGQPNVWEFVEVPGRVGALCNEVVVDVGTAEDPRHIFMGYEDFYSFDGARPVPIGSNRVKETVFGELNRNYSESSIALHDRTNSVIYFFYVTASSSTIDKSIVYNYRTDKWGRADKNLEAAFEYLSASMTYAGFGTSYATYADAPNVSYGSSLFVAGFPVPAIFGTDHKLYTLNAAAVAGSYTTGAIGDDNVEGLLLFVKPRYSTAPTGFGSQTNYYKQNLGDSWTTDGQIFLTSGRYDQLREARWHRVLHAHVGDWEASGLWWEIERAGSE